MDPCTYMNIKERLAQGEQAKAESNARPEVVSLNSFLRGLLELERGQAQSQGFMLPVQGING